MAYPGSTSPRTTIEAAAKDPKHAGMYDAAFLLAELAREIQDDFYSLDGGGVPNDIWFQQLRNLLGKYEWSNLQRYNLKQHPWSAVAIVLEMHQHQAYAEMLREAIASGNLKDVDGLDKAAWLKQLKTDFLIQIIRDLSCAVKIDFNCFFNQSSLADVVELPVLLGQEEADAILAALKERDYFHISFSPNNFESLQVYQNFAGGLLIHLFQTTVPCQISELKMSEDSLDNDANDPTYQWQLSGRNCQLTFAGLNSVDDLSLPLAQMIQLIRDRLQAIRERDFEADNEIYGLMVVGDNVKSHKFNELISLFEYICGAIQYLQQDSRKESFPQQFIFDLNLSSLCAEIVRKLIEYGFFNYAGKTVSDLVESNGLHITKDSINATLDYQELPALGACWELYQARFMQNGVVQLKAYFDGTASFNSLNDVLNAIFSKKHSIYLFTGCELFNPQELPPHYHAFVTRWIVLNTLQQGVGNPRGNFRKLFEAYEFINGDSVFDNGSGITVNATGRVPCNIKRRNGWTPLPYQASYECFKHDSAAAANSLQIAIAKHLKAAAIAALETSQNQEKHDCLRKLHRANNCSDLADVLASYRQTHLFSGFSWRKGTDNHLEDIRVLEDYLTQLHGVGFEEVALTNDATTAEASAVAADDKAKVPQLDNDAIIKAMVELQLQGGAYPMLKALALAKEFPREQREQAQEKLLDYADGLKKIRRAQELAKSTDARDAAAEERPRAVAESAASTSVVKPAVRTSEVPAAMFHVTYPALKSPADQLRNLKVADSDLSNCDSNKLPIGAGKPSTQLA